MNLAFPINMLGEQGDESERKALAFHDGGCESAFRGDSMRVVKTRGHPRKTHCSVGWPGETHSALLMDKGQGDNAGQVTGMIPMIFSRRAPKRRTEAASLGAHWDINEG